MNKIWTKQFSKFSTSYAINANSYLLRHKTLFVSIISSDNQIHERIHMY